MLHGSFASAMLIASFVTLVLFPSGSALAEVRDDPSPVTIELDSNHKEASVSPDDTGVVVFHATVECTFPDGADIGEVCTVDLRAWAHWQLSMEGSLNFSVGDGPKTVEIVVHVPINTSADERHDLTVTGNWTFHPGGKKGAIDHVTALITVAPFKRIFVGCNHPVLSRKVGEWAHYNIGLTNRGNTPLDIVLIFSSDGRHLSFMIPEANLHLEKGDTVNMTISARQRPSMSRSNTLHLVVREDEGMNETLYDLPLILRTRPRVSTFMYERASIVLATLLLIVAIIATALYVMERTEKGQGEDLEDGRTVDGINL